MNTKTTENITNVTQEPGHTIENWNELVLAEISNCYLLGAKKFKLHLV